MSAPAPSPPQAVPATEPILRTERLTRHYGGVRALTEVDFTVRPGALHAVIGPNGAGKSTLFHVITGRVPPSSGRIWYRGREITGLRQHQVARLGIARSYQITTVFLNLSVFENVRIAAQSKSTHTNFWRPANSFRQVAERAEEVLETIGLQDKRNLLAGQLSHGEQRHLDVGIALATAPGLLLLDEPTAGMSPAETERTMHFIRDLRQRVSIVLVEHKMNVIMQISDHITVLHFGQVLTEGTPEEVRNNPRVQEVYLEGIDLMLVVDNLHTYYGLAHVLQGVSLEIREREIVALLGRNGAGKSTTLKSIIGLVTPRRGSITFEGQALVGVPTHQIARRGIGYVPEERRIFPALTVLENLRVSMLAYKLPRPAESLERIFEMFPRLKEREGQLGRSLSGGEQQMLALARALISEPRLLLIDEPTQGLAPNLVTAIASSLVAIKERGLSVLLVEQNVRVALEIADRAYVIDHGTIQFGGSATELRENELVQREFLTV